MRPEYYAQSAFTAAVLLLLLLLLLLLVLLAVKRCAGLPPQQFNAGAWNASISNATVGNAFSINCTANITEGSGYTAACVADAIMPFGNWSVTGACPRELRDDTGQQVLTPHSSLHTSLVSHSKHLIELLNAYY